MRMVFGALSLLIVVAIVGVLARKQLGAAAPASAPPLAGETATMSPPQGTPQQKVQQFQQAVQDAQQARPVDDTK